MIQETSYTQARATLASLLDQVTDTREPVLIRRRGCEPIALIAAEDLASLQETAYLLRSPENARRLVEASEQLAHGKGVKVDVGELRTHLGLHDE